MKTPRELESERTRWDRLAKDPYYAVINDEAFRDERVVGAARERFVASGDHDVDEVMREVRQWIGADFRPRRALDFGCGVGRLTIPIARIADQVVGVDISDTMLVEARRNSAEAGLTNCTYVASADFFARDAADAEELDFIHSYIVFQHIPPRAGIWFAEQLVRRLAPGGVGALHFTYGRRASTPRQLVNTMRRYVRPVNMLANVVQKRPAMEPFIPMNRYDLGSLFTMLGRNGCAPVHARLTDHGGHLGAMLVFQRTMAAWA